MPKFAPTLKHMKKFKIFDYLPILGILGFVLFCPFCIHSGIIEKKNNGMINRDIFPAFRNIEGTIDSKYKRIQESGRDPELEMSVRELRILNALPQNYTNDPLDDISAEDYYNFLIDLGYDLPPFYKDGYVPLEPWWKFW